MHHDWYNSNLYRAYPFIDRDYAISWPDSTIVDAGFIFGPQIDLFSSPSGVPYKVYLESVSHVGGLFFFDFRCTHPLLAGVPLNFAVPDTTEEFTVFFAEVGSINLPASSLSSVSLPSEVSLGSLPQHCPNQLLWEGFIVIGSLEELSQLVPEGNTLSDPSQSLVIEPTLLQTTAGYRVEGVFLANKNRTHVTAPAGCSETWAPPLPDDFIIPTASCLQGHIRLKEGFNASIRQDNTTRSITIAAAVKQGAGEPCQEIPLYPGEAPPPGSPFLSGGLACHQVVQAINGVEGPIVNLYPGRGIAISPGQNPNQIIISIQPGEIEQCVEQSSQSL